MECGALQSAEEMLHRAAWGAPVPRGTGLTEDPLGAACAGVSQLQSCGSFFLRWGGVSRGAQGHACQLWCTIPRPTTRIPSVNLCAGGGESTARNEHTVPLERKHRFGCMQSSTGASRQPALGCMKRFPRLKGRARFPFKAEPQKKVTVVITGMTKQCHKPHGQAESAMWRENTGSPCGPGQESPPVTALLLFEMAHEPRGRPHQRRVQSGLSAS